MLFSDTCYSKWKVIKNCLLYYTLKKGFKLKGSVRAYYMNVSYLLNFFIKCIVDINKIQSFKMLFISIEVIEIFVSVNLLCNLRT